MAKKTVYFCDACDASIPLDPPASRGCEAQGYEISISIATGGFAGEIAVIGMDDVKVERLLCRDCYGKAIVMINALVSPSSITDLREPRN